MNKLKPIIWGALALILSVSGGISDTLKIGHIAGKTGWLKGPALSATVAVDMAVKEINAAGGVNGKVDQIQNRRLSQQKLLFKTTMSWQSLDLFHLVKQKWHLMWQKERRL